VRLKEKSRVVVGRESEQDGGVAESVWWEGNERLKQVIRRVARAEKNLPRQAAF
jgi:hypothetical protein